MGQKSEAPMGGAYVLGLSRAKARKRLGVTPNSIIFF